MPNLEQKFNTLQALLAANQATTLAAIAAQQSSLDTIAINSGLQSAALALVKIDTGSIAGKLDTIVQLLTDLNTATVLPDPRLDVLVNLARLESLEENTGLIRKLLGTTAQYAASENSQVSTVFGRLDNSLLQLAGAFVGPDGNFPGSMTSFGGVMASIFLNTVGLYNAGVIISQSLDGSTANTSAIALLQLIAASNDYSNARLLTLDDSVQATIPLLDAIRACACATTTPPDPTGCDPVVSGVLELGTTTSGETGLNPLSGISVNVQPGTSGAANGDQVASSAGCFVVFPGATSSHAGAAGNFVELNGLAIFNVFPPRKFAITVETAINSPVIKYYTINADSGIYQLEANLVPNFPIIIDPVDYTPATRFIIVVRGDNQNDATAGTVGLRVCP